MGLQEKLIRAEENRAAQQGERTKLQVNSVEGFDDAVIKQLGAKSEAKMRVQQARTALRQRPAQTPPGTLGRLTSGRRS